MPPESSDSLRTLFPFASIGETCYMQRNSKKFKISNQIVVREKYLKRVCIIEREDDMVKE